MSKMKIFKYCSLILYYGVANKLPNFAFPGGKVYNWLRIVLLRQILSIGSHCRIMRHVYVGDGNNIKIGSNCRINESCRLDNVQLGNNVMIARESILLGKMHEFRELEIPMVQQGKKFTNPIIIEDDVWLGLRVIVMPGVRIKKGCIIGAAAVVTKDTETNGIYGGVPAVLIKYRSNDLNGDHH